MTHVQVTVYIEKTAEEVFEYISNFENNPNWQGGMLSCKYLSQPSHVVGSEYQQTANFLGKVIESKFRVVEYIPGKRIKAKSIEGTFPIEFDRSVDPTESGCKVTAIVTGEPKGLFGILAPVLNLMVQKSIEKDYDTLKKLMEK